MLDAKVTSLFFDSDKVRRMVNAVTLESLSKAGAALRKTAQRSMSYVTSAKEQQKQIDAGKRKKAVRDPQASSPGEPPKAIKPHPWIRKLLAYSYEPQQKTVVVGPMRFGAATGAPNILEFGGSVRHKNPRRRIVKAGQVAPIAVQNGQLAYARLQTSAQVARANRIQQEQFGPEIINANIAARPYMAPALQKITPQLPSMFKSAVRS